MATSPSETEKRAAAALVDKIQGSVQGWRRRSETASKEPVPMAMHAVLAGYMKDAKKLLGRAGPSNRVGPIITRISNIQDGSLTYGECLELLDFVVTALRVKFDLRGLYPGAVRYPQHRVTERIPDGTGASDGPIDTHAGQSQREDMAGGPPP